MKDFADDEEWDSLSIDEKISVIKSTIEMADLVELCGRDVVRDKVRPPWNPGERTPSTHLYSDHFYD